MNAVGLLFKDQPNRNPFYMDLRAIQDDKIILKNPHKGWYWHYIDNGYGRENYRVEHDESDLLLDFPCLNHLYLRFDWGDIEKEEGILDWSFIDAIIGKWGSHGYKFAFRLCTYEAAGEGSLAFATPQWVFEAGAKFKIFKGAYEPDYGDRIFLEKLENFMIQFGHKFNGHPLVETIDVGTFGTWGEGHSAFGSDDVWPLETMKKHINLHVKCFPDTYILLNDDHINHRNACSKEENIELLNYAVQLGLGLRDDSVCVKYYVEHCGYDTLRTPFMFDHFYPQAPVDLEFEHYHTMSPEQFKDGLPFLSAMMRTHATFAGFHGYPRPWIEKNRNYTEYCANRLGYWYFIEGMEVPPLLIDASNYIKIYFSNRGWASAYWRYEARVKLVGDQTNHCFNQVIEIDNRKWLPNETVCERFKVAPYGILPGSYKFYFGLFEKGEPILFGISKEKYNDGYYELGEVCLTN